MPFSKADPNINRKGRGSKGDGIAKTFADLRKLANSIGSEMAYTPDGEPVQINGHHVNNVERLLYEWVRSRDGKKQLAFIEIAYGRIPTSTTGEGENKVTFNVIYGTGGPTQPPPPEPEPEPIPEPLSDPSEHKDSGLDVEYPEGEVLLSDDEDEESDIPELVEE